jgi:hypothetical protein
VLNRIQELTGLDFGTLPETIGLEAAAAGAKLVTGPESLVLEPPGTA